MIPTTLEEEPQRRDPNGGAPARVAAAPARSLLDVFGATVRRCGDRVAIDAADAVLTYAELSDASVALAGRLKALGVGPGDRVGVRVASGTGELYVAILGVLQSGAAYVPVDAEDPPVRAAEVWERSDACGWMGMGCRSLSLWLRAGRVERRRWGTKRG